jgi:hypothetical protein
MVDALESVVNTTIPAVFIFVATSSNLSAAPTHYTPPNPNNYPHNRIVSQYVMLQPASIATANDRDVVAVLGNRRLRPTAEEITLLTASPDNQTGSNLSIHLGNRLNAENDLLSGSVFLIDHVPVPKPDVIRRRSQDYAHRYCRQILDEEHASSASKVVAKFPDLSIWVMIMNAMKQRRRIVQFRSLIIQRSM